MESNSKIINYWEKQPDVLKNMIENSKQLTEKFVELYRKIKPTHLYLIGSGTSLNAEEITVSFFRKMLGIEVTTMPSSYVHDINGERPLAIIVSQGGSSTNTLSAMEHINHIPYITVTGEEVCEVAERSHNHMIIGCGEEGVGPKTIGYTASVMILYLMALEAARDTQSVDEHVYTYTIQIFLKSIKLMRGNMREAQKWILLNREGLKEIESYVLIGHGTTALALKEGCLKLLETVKKPALSYEFEEYLHGPILFVNSTVGGFIFASGNKESMDRFNCLEECQKKFSKYTYLITEDVSKVGDNVLHIKKTGESFTEVFETVVIPQLMAATIQGFMGIEDGSAIYDEYTMICPTKYNNGK